MLFREYFQSQIGESPFRTGMMFGDLLDDIIYNHEEAQKVVNNQDHHQSINLVLDAPGSPLHVYLDNREDKIDYYFIEIRNPEIRAWLTGRKDADNNYWSSGLWNKPPGGYARWLIFNFILKNYTSIISDNRHSTQGERCWKNCIQHAEEHGYKVVILNKGVEYKLDDLNNYWGNESEYKNYQIKIYAKQI